MVLKCKTKGTHKERMTFYGNKVAKALNALVSVRVCLRNENLLLETQEVEMRRAEDELYDRMSEVSDADFNVQLRKV